MTAALCAAASRPDPLDVFVARCAARAKLYAAGEYDLQEAVDELQAAAERDGLVATLGQDEVQRMLAEAFAPTMPAADTRATPEPAPHAAAASTLDAAEYLVMQGDGERLRGWLARHSAEERAAIREHLEARAWRSHSET